MRQRTTCDHTPGPDCRLTAFDHRDVAYPLPVDVSGTWKSNAQG
jgi:hypothetical protein